MTLGVELGTIPFVVKGVSSLKRNFKLGGRESRCQKQSFVRMNL